MFKLNNFIKKGLLDAVGSMADHQVILNAAGWHDKGVLSQDDLAEIEAAIDALHAAEQAAEADAAENSETPADDEAPEA